MPAKEHTYFNLPPVSVQLLVLVQGAVVQNDAAQLHKFREHHGAGAWAAKTISRMMDTGTEDSSRAMYVNTSNYSFGAAPDKKRPKSAHCRAAVHAGQGAHLFPPPTTSTNYEYRYYLACSLEPGAPCFVDATRINNSSSSYHR